MAVIIVRLLPDGLKVIRDPALNSPNRNFSHPAHNTYREAGPMFSIKSIDGYRAAQFEWKAGDPMLPIPPKVRWP
jgi:hypothetical protein